MRGPSVLPVGLLRRLRRGRPGGREPPGLLERLTQHVLDLSVDAAQLLGGPPLQRVVQIGIEPQQERLALRHQVYSVPVLTTGCVECSLHSTTSRLLTMAAL